MYKSKGTTVLIADADTTFSDSLEKILNERNFLVIDKVSSRSQLADTLFEVNPDLVIVDYNISQLTDGDAALDIHHRFPRQKILLLAYFANLDVFSFCIENGINGFQIKGCNPEELFESIETILNGGFALPGEHANSELSGDKPPILNALGKRLKLTLREIQVIKYMSDGISDENIAKLLFRSKASIEEYKNSIFEKTHISQLEHLIAYASLNLL